MVSWTLIENEGSRWSDGHGFLKEMKRAEGVMLSWTLRGSDGHGLYSEIIVLN